MSYGNVALHHLLYILQVIQLYTFYICDLWVNVTREGKVDGKHRMCSVKVIFEDYGMWT